MTSTKNVEMVRSIGADHVIDYTRDDFTAGAERYDLILDNVGNHSMAQTRRALTPDGTLISNGGGHAGRQARPHHAGMLVSMFVRQQASPTVKTQNHDDLVALKGLVEAGTVTPVIDRTYPLAETPQAIGRVAAGHARGHDRHHASDAATSAGSTSARPPPHRPIERNHTCPRQPSPALHRQPDRLRRRRRSSRSRPSGSRSPTTCSSWPAPTSSASGEARLAVVPHRRRRSSGGLAMPAGDRRPRRLDRRPAEHLAAREQGLVRRPAAARDLQLRLPRDDRLRHRRARTARSSAAGRATPAPIGA